MEAARTAYPIMWARHCVAQSPAMTPTQVAESLDKSYALLREASGLHELTGQLGIIRLSGEDRKAWLQGQTTNDVGALQIGGSQSFCILTPTGQILARCDCWRTEDAFLIAVDSSALAALVDRFETMIVMEQVTYESLTDRYRIFSVQGPGATQTLSGIFPLPTLDAGVAPMGKSEIVCLRSNRTGLGGWDLLVPKTARSAVKTIQEAVPEVGQAAYEMARLEAGLPSAGSDLEGKVLPPELGSAFMAKHVSHTKGCYTGQEVVHRIFARGHTNRTWVGVLADEMMRPGDAIIHAGKEVGTILSAYDSPKFGYMASAFVRNTAFSDGEEVTIQSGAESFGGELRDFPLLRF